ncbi:Cytosolic non-specific dipeptidase, related [Eimeria necatrix]|uniref:Cytosolic non-specific dipeptidase, related n=2 Tax=Eimeria TaxID=5800 RepID=U6MUI1_9EIME|nr:Cytosolic non-specific dipeptidase, related [Eimeria tenella]XP_013435210.1 Cytosolic non-specific dipeptidase, related [Eimeria necatrix]CDJ42525.1 Cytosolic non-specific dipeptidase, related [Eimeria tenella]CDJ66743.1 Cytosolic non-specific dipeptidase, related [Eimeria necatrix]|eukprot:XP_013233275.1 Cytosolic non-specific dipeptidase, related [Eimeria tenella]
MRGVLDIRVEATGGAEDSGYHSGVHGGAVEEPMQSLVQLLSQMYDPSTGRVKIPRFYDAVQPPDYAELQRVKAAADSVKTGWVQRASAGGTSDPNELLRKSWLEPSMSLLGIDASLKGKCPHAGGAMRVIPSTVCAEISLRLVPQQGPKEIFTLIRDYLQESFKKASSASKLAVQCLRQGRSWRADLNAPRTRALYGAAHAAIKEVWGVEPLYVREGGSMPAIPFLADAFRRLPGPLGQCQGSDEVAVCQLPFGQASDNAHLPNERLGIRQVEKGVDVLACTLESLAARLAESTSRPVVAL